jgi:hypothetical protein
LGLRYFFLIEFKRLILEKEGTILWTKGIPLDETMDSSMPDIIIHDIFILTMLATPSGVGVLPEMLIKFVI